MKTLASWLACLALAGCANAPSIAPVAAPAPVLLDTAFAPPHDRIRAEDVFALSEPMERYLRNEIANQARVKGRQQALVDALYTRELLRLEYDSAMTRNASEAFDARAGNCLSLVIMTAAFAKAMGLKVEYQSAFLEETWSRTGDLVFRSGHVNVTLGPRLFDHGGSGDFRAITVDFLSAWELRGLRTHAIDEPTVVAMYMNNRAAEALAQGRLDDAYAWAREAVRQNPAFLSAQNTLGVIYLRHGNVAAAEQVFRDLLAHEPANTRAMSNLAQVLQRSGREAEAANLRRELARLEPTPPFHFFNLGMAAMERGDYAAARDWFAKEVARADYYHEFHYWLGLAQYRLGDMEEARKNLTRAMEASNSRREHDLYAAKLAWLRTQRQH